MRVSKPFFLIFRGRLLDLISIQTKGGKEGGRRGERKEKGKKIKKRKEKKYSGKLNPSY